MYVFNVSIDRWAVDAIQKSLSETGNLPKDLDDLFEVTLLTIDSKTRYIINWKK